MSQRVFLDANVLFSAAYQDGLARSLWAARGPKKLELVTSQLARAEAHFNLGRKGPRGSLERFEALMQSVSVAAGSVKRQSRDLGLPESDHLILSSAMASRARFFLTGDRRHFGPLFGKMIEGVRIMSIRSFVDDVL